MVCYDYFKAKTTTVGERDDTETTAAQDRKDHT